MISRAKGEVDFEVPGGLLCLDVPQLLGYRVCSLWQRPESETEA